MFSPKAVKVMLPTPGEAIGCSLSEGKRKSELSDVLLNDTVKRVEVKSELGY